MHFQQIVPSTLVSTALKLDPRVVRKAVKRDSHRQESSGTSPFLDLIRTALVSFTGHCPKSGGKLRNGKTFGVSLDSQPAEATGRVQGRSGTGPARCSTSSSTTPNCASA
jgi:hypothetical protein